MATTKEMIEALGLDQLIELNDIPNLDLYMDQVITLFENHLAHTKRRETDKLLTKTMINNYAKDKLLMPAVKKKYTKEHVLLMILLYEMKQILTIGDIKILFELIIKEDQVDPDLLSQVYQIYLNMKQKGVIQFEEQVSLLETSLKQEIQETEIAKLDEAHQNAKLEDMLLVILLTQKANYYKRLAEKIIDEKIINNP